VLVALDLAAEAVVLAELVVVRPGVAVDHQDTGAVRREHVAQGSDDGGVGHGPLLAKAAILPPCPVAARHVRGLRDTAGAGIRMRGPARLAAAACQARSWLHSIRPPGAADRSMSPVRRRALSQPRIRSRSAS